MKPLYWEKQYRRSMSSMISFARACPCSIARYSPTHVTRWSLNVPLINWCKISGDSISWISARGKSYVKGCNHIVWMYNPIELKIDTIYLPQHRHQFRTHPKECLDQRWPVTHRSACVFSDHPVHQDQLKGQYTFPKLISLCPWLLAKSFYSLWTPILYDPRKQYLFWIVCNKCS